MTLGLDRLVAGETCDLVFDMRWDSNLRHWVWTDQSPARPAGLHERGGVRGLEPVHTVPGNFRDELCLEVG